MAMGGMHQSATVAAAIKAKVCVCVHVVAVGCLGSLIILQQDGRDEFSLMSRCCGDTICL